MPEFQLNDNGHGFANAFMSGYVEAMFFTNGDTGDDNEHLLNNLGTARLTKAARKRIGADCRAFLSHIMPDVCFAQQWIDRFPKNTAEAAGRDFWFTRQGHGCGFWDGDWRDGEDDVGDELTEAADAFGECYVEVSRGWIHVR
jgi:hypothetical protein